jgi:hypothetical protein
MLYLLICGVSPVHDHRAIGNSDVEPTAPKSKTAASIQFRVVPTKSPMAAVILGS